MSNQNISDFKNDLLDGNNVSEKTRRLILNFVEIVEGTGYRGEKFKKEWEYLISLVGGWKDSRLYDNLEKICLFIGFPRSGHTLVSCLIDAHQNMLLSNEEDVLWLIKNGYNKKQVYYKILNNSRQEAKNCRKSSGYQFHVANQWNGKFENLKVIGDKAGPLTVIRLMINKHLLAKMTSYFKVPVKYICTLRNPYDNIQTIAKKDFGGMELQVAAELYFILCKAIDIIEQQIDRNNILFVRHEAIVKSSEVVLKGICSFFEVEASKDYLQDCGRIVYNTPHQSRFEGNWTPELINWVADQIAKYEFLNGYSYYE